MNNTESFEQKDLAESHLRVVDELLTEAKSLSVKPQELVPSPEGLRLGGEVVLDLLTQAEANLNSARDLGTDSDMIKPRREKIAMIRFGLPAISRKLGGWGDKGGMSRVVYKN